MEMFPSKRAQINIYNQIPDEEVVVDETKFILAIRNLLDNAIKYSMNEQKIDLTILKSDNIEFQVRDYGMGIYKGNMDKLHLINDYVWLREQFEFRYDLIA